MFWFGFEVVWAKLVAVRFVLFALLAIDAFLQIRHAPRYGAGDFNVAHVGFLDALGPGQAAFEVGQLVLAYLFVLAAFGAGTRLVLPIAAVLYAWLYFGSQLDSYQHHYLVAILVGIACFVPWQRPIDAEPRTRVRTWAIRLVLVQLAILYLWAAISKLDPAWTGGRTLGGQLTGSLRAAIDRTIGMPAASVLVIVVELVLACTIWLRPAWIVAAPLGLLLHLGIAASDLEIGLFAYLMLALYLLVLPDALFVWLADTAPGRGLRAALRWVATAGAGVPGWIACAAALAIGIVVGALLPLERGVTAAVLASAILVVLAVHAAVRATRAAPTLAAAHMAAAALWLGGAVLSSVPTDYYKYWAGSLRRLGDTVGAEHAYRRLVEVEPELELGHYYLGRILMASGRSEDGLVHLREAQRLEPTRARAWIEETRWHLRQGKRAEAIESARMAAAAEPRNPEARTLLQNLLANTPAPPPGDDSEKP